MRTLWAIAAAAALPTTMGQPPLDVRRRLSRSDGVKWRGTLNSSAIVNKYLYVFVHIPKNAGASFMKDSPETPTEGRDPQRLARKGVVAWLHAAPGPVLPADAISIDVTASDKNGL